MAASVEVTVWRDHVLAIDEGQAAADWFGEHLRRDVRLVRFDDARPRPTDPAWSQGLAGTSAFSDGYPVLVLSRASLDDLNARLPSPLPVDRFRPNVFLDGCAPYAEDAIRGLESEQMRLRIVKPCTRCIITTTDQATAVPQGDEPLRTLKTYRWDRRPARREVRPERDRRAAGPARSWDVADERIGANHAEGRSA